MLGEPGIGNRDQSPVEPLLRHTALAASNEDGGFVLGINHYPSYSIIGAEPRFFILAYFDPASVSSCGRLYTQQFGYEQRPILHFIGQPLHQRRECMALQSQSTHFVPHLAGYILSIGHRLWEEPPLRVILRA